MDSSVLFFDFCPPDAATGQGEYKARMDRIVNNVNLIVYNEAKYGYNGHLSSLDDGQDSMGSVCPPAPVAAGCSQPAQSGPLLSLTSTGYQLIWFG